VKVLIWRGNPVGVYGREYRRDLLRIWVDSERRINIQAMEADLEELADAVSDDIDQRLNDPRGPVFMRLTGESREKEVDGKPVFGGSVTRQELALPGDDNFLEVLKSDSRLIGRSEEKGIAGYTIYDGYSRIVEE